uniref:Uncharacterized protein n=1 Tax=Glossina austeni TaxID=7395 RepID=A0A1A9VIQ1_GLOAU
MKLKVSPLNCLQIKNPYGKITYVSADVDSSSEDEATNTVDDDDTNDMEVDLEGKTDSVFNCPFSSQCITQSHIRQTKEFVEPDPAWTTVRGKKNKNALAPTTRTVQIMLTLVNKKRNHTPLYGVLELVCAPAFITGSTSNS